MQQVTCCKWAPGACGDNCGRTVSSFLPSGNPGLHVQRRRRILLQSLFTGRYNGSELHGVVNSRFCVAFLWLQACFKCQLSNRNSGFLHFRLHQSWGVQWSLNLVFSKLEHFYCTLQGLFSLLEHACFDHWPLPKYSDITMMDTELRVVHQFRGPMLIPFMPFHKGHADSSLSTLSAHAQPSLSGMGSFISLGLSFCSFSETMLRATKMLKHLRCARMKIKIQFLFQKIGF